MNKILLVIIGASLLLSCNHTSGSGNIVKSDRSVGDFNAVSAAGGFEVEIRPGRPYQVLVEADDNLIDEVETKVSGGKLKIRMKDHFNLRNAHLKVFITAPGVTGLESSAAADMKVIGSLAANRSITVHSSSGSSITADLDAPFITAESSSGAQINLSGRTKNLRAESSSGASIDAAELLSEITNAQTSSGASVQVHASVQLDAKASSGGNVRYRGAAALVKKESSGGSIEKDN